MAEMILPGTYIEVRAEGLIRPGSVSVGNIGIVGTASRGKLNKVYTPANIGDARDIFGEPDAYKSGGRELTLIRALELAYANGAQRVFAVRVASEDKDPPNCAEYELPTNSDSDTIKLKAKFPGSDYNDARFSTGNYTLGLSVITSNPSNEIEVIDHLPQDPDKFVETFNQKSRLFVAQKNGAEGEISINSVITKEAAKNAQNTVFHLRQSEDPNAVNTIVFTAKNPGVAMNAATIKIEDSTVDSGGPSAQELCKVTVTTNQEEGPDEEWGEVPRLATNFVEFLNGNSSLFELKFGEGTDPAGWEISNEVVIELANDGTEKTEEKFIISAGEGSLEITARESGFDISNFTASISGYLDRVQFKLGRTVEAWRVVPSDAELFKQVINGESENYDYLKYASTRGGSNLFEVGAVPSGQNVKQNPEETKYLPLEPVTNGENGAAAEPTDYETGLACFENQDVHIIVLAGEGVTAGRDMKTVLVAHLETASDDLMRRERIGIIGCDKYSNPTDLETPDQLDGRLLFVGPGIQAYDAASNRVVTLPGTYTAAAVAGKLSALAPHESLTNKPINVMGLEKEFNGTELEQLLQNRVLALESRNGATRVVRGITSSTNTAWKQITTRRIVDYAKFGVRAAANPFIGKLNNARVRAAMKGSVNSFLADMVDREMLISYELDVSATRDQEIRGIAQIILVLNPTFSIDFIRVVMYLG
jgi:hypothetical protein